MNTDSGIQIDLIGALRRHAFLACTIAGATTLVMYWIAMALPNKYSASAVLLVEPQAVSERLVEAGAARVDLNARLHLMTSEILSRTRLSRIIDELELFQKQSEEMTRQEVVDEMRAQIAVKPVLPELTRGLRRTSGNIEINTFEIFFISENPKIAALVAQRLANDFIQEHIAARVRTTQTSLEFISAEQERLAESLNEVTSGIAQVKEKNERSLPENLPLNQRLHERSITEIRYAQREIDQARSDQSFWEHQILAASQQSLFKGDEKTSPTQRLQALELQLAELIARGYTERHPDIISTKHEIDEVEVTIARSAAEAEKMAEDEVVPKSFVEQSARAEKLRSDARLTAAQSEFERLQVQLGQIQADIAATPRVAELLGGLTQRHAQLSLSLDSFAKLQLDAAVQADLERRQLGERFRILESAMPPRKPFSPNRRLILMMGMVFGLALGIAAGVVLEGTDPSFHRQQDLQSSMGFPVLAVIPVIQFDSDLLAIARQRRMRMMVIAAVTGFCLLGGVLTYLWVNGAPGWLSGILKGGEQNAEADQREVRLYSGLDVWV